MRSISSCAHHEESYPTRIYTAEKRGREELEVSDEKNLTVADAQGYLVHTCANLEDVPVSKETSCHSWKNPHKFLFLSQQETKIHCCQPYNSEPTSVAMNMN